MLEYTIVSRMSNQILVKFETRKRVAFGFCLMLVLLCVGLLGSKPSLFFGMSSSVQVYQLGGDTVECVELFDQLLDLCCFAVRL